MVRFGDKADVQQKTYVAEVEEVFYLDTGTHWTLQLAEMRCQSKGQEKQIFGGECLTDIQAA